MEASGDEPDSRLSVQEQVPQLWWYQNGLRLRHLSQVVGRNLQGHGQHPAPAPACPLPTVKPRPTPTLGYFFTLHVPASNEELFRSELQSTTNPNWLEIEQEDLNPINFRSLKGIVIRLWFQPEGEPAIPVTSWGIHFSGLVPVGSSLPCRQDKYEPNTLVLKLRQIFYMAPSNFHDPEGKKTLPVLRHGLSLPLSETKRSYTVSALSRLHSTKRAQRQQEIRWRETRELLEARGVTRTSSTQVLAAQVEDCRVKVALLRKQLEAEIDKLRAIKLSADNLDNQNQEKGLELLGGYQGLHRQLMLARSCQEADASQLEALKEACECLGSWRRLLISQLPDIYPITQDSKGKYCICGVHLPDAENFEGVSETSLSVALGFVAHLLVLLSQLLHLPLRYPVNPHGSMATITDISSHQMRDDEREFPLYTRGKEKERLHFNYGVFLLNKNISQMRWYFGIPTTDLRTTLANLHFMMMRITQGGNGGSQQPALMPDVLIPIPRTSNIHTLEVHTPASLLQQQHTPRLPLNPLASASTSTSHARVILGENEEEENNGSSHWKLTKSSSETNSSEPSPMKESLYVREAAPLHEGTTGKFVFVDKVKNPLASVDNVEQDLDERLKHSNGFSFSLDNGLNHIGGKNESYYKIKDLSSCDDLKLVNNVSKALSHGCGSDPSLLTTTNRTDAEVGEEDVLPVFKEKTTELLRSWHEDDPSHYTGTLETYSSERLEEVGIECDESFMCTDGKLEGESKKDIPQQESEPDEGIAGEGNTEAEDSVLLSTDVVDSKAHTSDEESKGTAAEGVKNGNDVALSLSELEISEDGFLNDVAFRTEALASQNFSFKMSFSRQSTEDEYH
ncbi:hypothetical protein Pcinc_024990 [Petrolisthes cinctipes]|uniref:UV radiation resistance associated protein n=1 Tax=Petrolisthes cinctipes TaxID=88211 RepID=A0AAE1F9C2_PETCI|nr:hypothetical protein Pcinc_024990 [Petrolisthes cinctipes]